MGDRLWKVVMLTDINLLLIHTDSSDGGTGKKPSYMTLAASKLVRAETWPII